MKDPEFRPGDEVFELLPKRVDEGKLWLVEQAASSSVNIYWVNGGQIHFSK